MAIRRAHYFLALLMLFPAVAWIWLDRSYWPWDPAMYGSESLRLFHVLLKAPGNYMFEFFHVYGFKAPMLGWMGQLFAPLGPMIGYETALLLLPVGAFGAFLFILIHCMPVQSSTSVMSASAALIFAAGTPLLAGLSGVFFVETLQLCAVAWTFYIYRTRKDRSSTQLVISSLTAAIFGIGIKITTPLYVVIPFLIIVCELCLRRSKREIRSNLPVKELKSVDLVIFACIAIPVFAWYTVNCREILAFAQTSSAGANSLLYGHKGSFIPKALFWFLQIENVILGGQTSFFFILFFILTIPSAFRVSKGSIDLAVAILQILLVTAFFSIQINEEPRYLLPLLIYFSFILFTASSVSRTLALICIALLSFRFFETNLIRFGVTQPDHYIPWLSAFQKSDKERSIGENIVKDICSNPNAFAIVGADFADFNQASFQMSYFKISDAIKVCRITHYDYAETSLSHALQRMAKLRINYYVAPPRKRLESSVDAFNKISLSLYDNISVDSAWVLIKSTENYQIFIRTARN